MTRDIPLLIGQTPLGLLLQETKAGSSTSPGAQEEQESSLLCPHPPSAGTCGAQEEPVQTIEQRVEQRKTETETVGEREELRGNSDSGRSAGGRLSQEGL